MRISGSAILWPWLCAFAVFSSCPCFSQAAQQPDYREKTQSLSQNIHATLDELKAQQEILQNALSEAKSNLKSSQEQVKKLKTEYHDLSISWKNTSERLVDYAMKSTVLEHSRNKWRISSLSAWGIIIAYAVMKLLKILGKLHVPFI